MATQKALFYLHPDTGRRIILALVGNSLEAKALVDNLDTHHFVSTPTPEEIDFFYDCCLDIEPNWEDYYPPNFHHLISVSQISTHAMFKTAEVLQAKKTFNKGLVKREWNRWYQICQTLKKRNGRDGFNYPYTTHYEVRGGTWQPVKIFNDHPFQSVA